MRSRNRMIGMILAALIVGTVGGAIPAVAVTDAAAPADDAIRPAAVTVSIRDNSFSPRNLMVTRGTTVTWMNRGEDDHTTTSTTGLWDVELQPGQSFTRVFNRRGTFRYICRFHDEMSGSIRVS